MQNLTHVDIGCTLLSPKQKKSSVRIVSLQRWLTYDSPHSGHHSYSK